MSVVGAGPPAVLWHGMFVDGDSWQALLSELGSSRRLVVIDGPGHGRSDWLLGPASISSCADASCDVLDELGLAEPIDWVGNAWGGHVGLALAVRQPRRVRTLVAVSSPPEAIGRDLRLKTALLARLLPVLGFRGPVRRAVLASQLTDASRRDPALVSRVDAMIDRAKPASLAWAVRSFILGRQDVRDDLSRIVAPTLLIGSDDRAGSGSDDVRSAARLMPLGRHAVISGARALVPLEQPAELARLILDHWSAPDGA